MFVLKCFFNKIVKFTFANVWSGISVRLRPREAVSLVLFDPFCTMEEHNNIIVLHLIHAAAIENECAATASVPISAARGAHQGGSLHSARPRVQAAFPLHKELKVNRGSTTV